MGGRRSKQNAAYFKLPVWQRWHETSLEFQAALNFYTEREVTRKKYVASLEQRTPQQIAEEDALYIELKRLEQTERRFKKDRDELLRTLLGVESGLPDIPVEDEAPVNGNGLHIDTAAPPPKDVKKTKKRGANDVDTPTSAGPSSVSVISLGQSAQKKAQPAKNARYGPYHFLECFSCEIDVASGIHMHNIVYKSFCFLYDRIPSVLS